jgi:hypothetical protein
LFVPKALEWQQDVKLTPSGLSRPSKTFFSNEGCITYCLELHGNNVQATSAIQTKD